MNRIVLVFLIIILSIITQTNLSVAGGFVWITMNPPSLQKISASNFYTDVMVSSWNCIVAAMEISIHYDPEALEVVDFSVPTDSVFYNNCFSNIGSNIPGEIRIACFQVTNWNAWQYPLSVGTLSWKIVSLVDTITELNVNPIIVVDAHWLPVEAEGYGTYIDIVLGKPVNLVAGWNLISVPVEPMDCTIHKVLEPISDKYLSVWTYYDGSWMKSIVGAPAEYNNLDKIESGRGYWINMKDSATLIFIGNPITDPTVPLKAGWNLVGYKGSASQPIENALLSIADKLISVWSYDQNNGWKRYINNASGNNLWTMEPGRGYWIKVTDECLWNINMSSLDISKDTRTQ